MRINYWLKTPAVCQLATRCIPSVTHSQPPSPGHNHLCAGTVFPELAYERYIGQGCLSVDTCQKSRLPESGRARPFRSSARRCGSALPEGRGRWRPGTSRARKTASRTKLGMSVKPKRRRGPVRWLGPERSRCRPNCQTTSNRRLRPCRRNIQWRIPNYPPSSRCTSVCVCARGGGSPPFIKLIEAVRGCGAESR